MNAVTSPNSNNPKSKFETVFMLLVIPFSFMGNVLGFFLLLQILNITLFFNFNLDSTNNLVATVSNKAYTDQFMLVASALIVLASNILDYHFYRQNKPNFSLKDISLTLKDETLSSLALKNLKQSGLGLLAFLGTFLLLAFYLVIVYKSF